MTAGSTTPIEWELREHPLPEWPAENLLALLEATLDGDPSALRTAFERVEGLCAAFYCQRSQPLLTTIIGRWGDELRLLRR